MYCCFWHAQGASLIRFIDVFGAYVQVLARQLVVRVITIQHKLDVTV